jgi:hypothetical protein
MSPFAFTIPFKRITPPSPKGVPSAPATQSVTDDSEKSRSRSLDDKSSTMKIRLLVALAGLAISFALPTFAQQKDTVDPKIDQQIRALAMKYVEAFNRNDAAALAALYSEDAVWRTPQGTFSGRKAIEKHYADYQFHTWHSDKQVLKVDRVIAVGNEAH